jgi:hypothetical protein
MLYRENKISLINNNIQVINDYLDDLMQEQVEELFKNLEDVFFFYGIKESQIRQIIKAGAINNATILGLSELYAITNAILFQLKYKIKSKYTYTPDIDN